jgi:hypothetical protein
MSGQREGLIGDIFNKVKDLITDEDPKAPPQEDPPLETQCCGRPPGVPVVGTHLISEGEFEHAPDCPNHPDNVAKEEVAS